MEIEEAHTSLSGPPRFVSVPIRSTTRLANHSRFNAFTKEVRQRSQEKMALGIFPMPNRSYRFARWLEMLAECRSEIEQVQDDLYRSYFEIVHQLLSGTISESADSVLEIVRNSVGLLDVLSPRDTADRQMHREVYVMTDHVVALTSADVSGEWKKRGYMHNLREILRAVMFLQALYQGLRKLSFCDASIPLPPDTQWVLEVFEIETT